MGTLTRLALACGLSCVTATAHGQTPPEAPRDEVVWPARKFAWYDYAYTGALVAGAAGTAILWSVAKKNANGGG